MYCVTVGGLTPGAAVSVVGLPIGYSLSGVLADGEGKVYLWLPDGEWHLSVNGGHYRATVAGADVTAEAVSGTVYLGGIVSNRFTGAPESGVAVQLSTGEETVTDESGRYTFEVEEGWSGTVQPVLFGECYIPHAGHSILAAGADRDDLDFERDLIGLLVDEVDVGHWTGEEEEWTYEGGVLTISGGRHRITCGSAVPTVPVVVDGDAELVLGNLRLDLSERPITAALTVNAGVVGRLTRDGANVLTGGGGRAGIYVEAGARVTVTEASTGSLETHGGANWPGIGGPGGIEIAGGKVKAQGAAGSPGISGGKADAATTRLNMAVNGFCAMMPGVTYEFHDSGGPSGEYGNNENRKHVFASADGSPVRATFNQFSTEITDVLRIYDGNVLVAQGAGTELNGRTVEALSGTMKFVFASDGAQSGAGWKVTFGVVPGGDIRVENINMCNGSKVLQPGVTYRFYDSGGPSGQYGNNQSYRYTFTSYDGSPLVLRFTSYSSEGCDYLSLSNNNTQIRYASSGWGGNAYTASSGIMKAGWYSDYSVVYDGWAAEFDVLPSAAEFLRVTGGTLEVASGTGATHDILAEQVEISGGSVKADHMMEYADNAVKMNPTNAAGEAVHCVTVAGLTAGAAVSAEWVPLGYGARGLVADEEGKVYLWLADGESRFELGGAHYAAEVAGADTTAELLEGVGFLTGVVTNPSGG